MIAFFLLALALVVAFYVGICVGIADCKRRFAVPKSAVGVDEFGNFIYS